jgi:hypothetical protein
MLVRDTAATCCLVEDVSLGTSYGSLAVLLHMGACSQSVSVLYKWTYVSDSVLYKWNYLAAAPCIRISMSSAYCYQVSRLVATAAHACFVVAQSHSCALFVVVCSQLWYLFL